MPEKVENTEIKKKLNLKNDILFKAFFSGRLNIQAILNDGMIVNIEMQMKDSNNIEQRNDIYEAKTISRYFPRGGEYSNAKEVIAIYILNYNLFGFDDYLLDTIKVLNNHRDYQVNSISKEYYIQLPKFRESNPDRRDLWESDRNSEIGWAKREAMKQRKRRVEENNGKEER